MFRFFSKVWSEFKEYIVLVITVLLSLVILTQNHNPKVQKVRAIAFGTFASASSIVSDLFSTKSLKRENRELRETNAKLMLRLSKLREFGITNDELRNLVHFKDTTSFPLVPASIVSKSLSYTQNSITLNVGAKDSVLPGMPVINDEGLIGIVQSTSEDFSIAKTLHNVDLKLTVMDERSRINGILKWTGEDLIIMNIPNTYDIEVGDRIVTSDISSIIPVPVPVGIIEEFKPSETGVFSFVKVKPFVNLTTIDNLFILAIVKSKQVEDLELNFYRQK
jgi:rod shape-determining protein MreC